MILSADWVLPLASPPIRNGWVSVQRDRIAAVGAPPAPASPGQRPTTLPGCALLPGFVNPHTHLELTCYAGRIAPAPFWSWITELIKLRAAPGQTQREAAAAADGAWQSLRAGVTCVGDISRLNLHWRALKPIPIRKVCFVELLSLADAPPRDPNELRAAVDGVQEDPLLTLGVSPHAPYSVPRDHFTAALRLARELDRPWCTHWAESAEEVAFLRGDENALPEVVRNLARKCGVSSPGAPPAAALEYCTGGATRGALAHLNYASAEDAARLARRGHVGVYCPRAHRFFAHPVHPIVELRRAGLRMAIGTDSAASNENLSMLDELRFLARARPELPPADLLRMGTLDAAAALRLEHAIGSLEPGKQADLVALRVAGAPADDPYHALLHGETHTAAVWVAGTPVVGYDNEHA